MYIKLFEDFNEIHEICRKYRITNYTINSDGTINVDGNVDLFDRKLDKLPLKFKEVSGYFDCSDNIHSSELCLISVNKNEYLILVLYVSLIDNICFMFIFYLYLYIFIFSTGSFPISSRK